MVRTKTHHLVMSDPTTPSSTNHPTITEYEQVDENSGISIKVEVHDLGQLELEEIEVQTVERVEEAFEDVKPVMIMEEEYLQQELPVEEEEDVHQQEQQPDLPQEEEDLKPELPEEDMLSESLDEEDEVQKVIEDEAADESDLNVEEALAASLIAEIAESPTSYEQSKYVVVECRSVRIGSYKCIPLLHSKTAYFKVFISEKGILFSVPHSQFKHKIVKCAVPAERITQVAGHFRARLPALFVKVESRYAAWIRNRLALGKHPSEKLYFGSAHGDDLRHKYIVLIPDEFQERVPHILRKIYEPIFQELDFKSVNSLLMSTILLKSPPENK